MPPGGAPPAVHSWVEATIRGLNWLSVGSPILEEGLASSSQEPLVKVLCIRCEVWPNGSIVSLIPVRLRRTGGQKVSMGRGIHSELSFKWSNVTHSLPPAEFSGALDAVSLCTAGIRDFGGLLGVPKDEQVGGVPVLRLIMDLRSINQLFTHWPCSVNCSLWNSSPTRMS